MARDVRAETLVTACPWCETNIGDAAAVVKARDGGADLPVLDIVDVVIQALGRDAKADRAPSRRRAPGRLT